VGGLPWLPHGGQAVTQSTAPLSFREVAVEAHVGDTIVVHSAHQGEPERTGVVIECHEPDGGPPYRVQWEPDGHTGLFYPAGTAAVVHHTGPSHS
jgi:hypothetical protein